MNDMEVAQENSEEMKEMETEHGKGRSEKDDSNITSRLMKEEPYLPFFCSLGKSV